MNDTQQQSFLDSLAAYPKEVVDLFLVNTIKPEHRADTLKVLQHLAERCEEVWLREELDTVRDQIERLAGKRGRKSLSKVDQLRKRAVGLQAAIMELKIKKPAGGSSNVPAGSQSTGVGNAVTH